MRSSQAVPSPRHGTTSSYDGDLSARPPRREANRPQQRALVIQQEQPHVDHQAHRDVARPTTATTSTSTSSPSGPMTRARAKLLQAKVTSLLSLCDFDTPLDGLLLHTHTLCILRYEEKDPRNGGEATSRCQTQAVLPTGTNGQRYYRPLLPL